MTTTFKQLKEKVLPGQLDRLKKAYEPLRKTDMSKHTDAIKQATAMLNKLSQPGTLVQLSKADIPVVSDVAKNLMKRRGITEADLSKAQVKMVHKQADELPKNDFIKRYGKDGDAVRFATATNQVKKKLGIEEGTWHIAKDITKLKNTMKQPMPLGKGSFDFVADFIGDDELWDDLQDLKTGQDMVPAIKKAMKRLGVKEEVKEMNFDRMLGIKDRSKKSRPSTKDKLSGNEKKLTPAQKDKIYKIADKHSGNMKKAMREIERMPVFASGIKDDPWVMDVLRRHNEEVELDEVHFSNRGEPSAPKGMHKLRSGRDIPSSPKADKIHKKVASMTDRNDHFGAVIELAKECGDKQLVQVYSTLQLMHDKYGVVGNKSIELRQIFQPVLRNQVERKFGKVADVLWDAL